MVIFENEKDSLNKWLMIRDLLVNVSIIHEKLEQFQEAGKSLFCSSSFQTHSIPLLHIIAQFDQQIPVYFLDTGFHFPETITFRNKVTEMLGINTVVLSSPVVKLAQLTDNGYFLYTCDPDRCCFYNKVMPMQPILKEYDVWINGVRRDQTKVRNGMDEEQQTKEGCLRYHPILDWTDQMIAEYRHAFSLPVHPLEGKGFKSIGCAPCTRKASTNGARNGRWEGLEKTECGLQLAFEKS
jgi:phosphoadenosine phosphosulfate reductase